MNINYGLLPDLDTQPTHDRNGVRLKGPERGREKKRAMSRRALADLERWLCTGATPVIKRSA
jgi:methylenetetrahydrofolate--tRNA-(uracil-5-)-methyltransferase